MRMKIIIECAELSDKTNTEYSNVVFYESTNSETLSISFNNEEGEPIDWLEIPIEEFVSMVKRFNKIYSL